MLYFIFNCCNRNQYLRTSLMVARNLFKVKEGGPMINQRSTLYTYIYIYANNYVCMCIYI